MLGRWLPMSSGQRWIAIWLRALDPMGLVADASRLVPGSFYRMAWAMRATRGMSGRPMVSAALMPSRDRSEERPSPA
jgi:hypothetical protein